MTMPSFVASYPQVLAHYFPDTEFVSYGDRYEDIVWLSETVVNKSSLDSKLVEFLQSQYINWVRDEAKDVREEASFRVIGSSDPSMLKVYDKKKEQSLEFMARFDNNESPETLTYSTMSSALASEDQDTLNSRYPLVFVEAEGTGVTLWQQCYAVLDQYRLSEEHLDPILGQIEVIRRNKIAEFLQAQTEAEVYSVSAPVWPDLSSLQEI